jgi:hypothetical protein
MPLLPVQRSVRLPNLQFSQPICVAAMLFAALSLAAVPTLAEDTMARARFREPDSIQIGADQPYYLTASQLVIDESYELRYNHQFPGEQIHMRPDGEKKIHLVNQLQGLSVELLKTLWPCVVG